MTVADAPSIQVVLVDSDRMKDIFAIRRRVFIEEQGVPEAIEMDADDARAVHVLASCAATPVGCARIMPDGERVKIGRMAVIKEWRGRGAGGRILEFVLDYARSLGYQRAVLNAQLNAIRFYSKYGFTPNSEIFDEAGIPHRRMELVLART
ncbi:MAG: GNAT family N-acetyltransferase [Candidatus Binataceae bacterium]